MPLYYGTATQWVNLLTGTATAYVGVAGLTPSATLMPTATLTPDD